MSGITQERAGLSKLPKRLAWHVVLALVLLLMQQAGLRHALQHVTDRAARDDGSATHAVCVECLAHHAHDAGVTPTVPSLVLAHLDHALTADAAQPQCGQGFGAGYQSRAPPSVLSA